MVTKVFDTPKRTTFVVKDADEGMIPLWLWCKNNKCKYNTIQARVWRAGLSGNGNGMVVLYPESKHRELFKKVREKRANGEGS